MIVDKISNWKIYFKEDRFNEIFNELKKITINTPSGEYRTNENFYFKVMSYETKLESKIIESHRKEVDIQILLEGKEKIKIFNFNDVEITQPYEVESDCQFYIEKNDCVSEINLTPGYMAVFFPDDIHNPILSVNQEINKLKKIVIKVNEKFFS